MYSSDEVVFVVDDDEASAISLQALLEANDFRVRVYSSAEEFLDAYQGEKGCLVLDLRLPGMSGLELQKEVVDRGLGLPVVMISGHADGQSHRQAMANGSAAFLQKPFSGASLCCEVRRALLAASSAP